MPFSSYSLECKRRSRDPGVTGKFGLGVQNEAEQWLTEFCQENTLVTTTHSLPTTQENTLHMNITRWSTLKSDWLYSLHPKMELYTVSKNKTGSWLWLRSWTPYCQIQLKLKKVGKTTRAFRYDLNQIPYNCTVEVTNRYKGLDLIEHLKTYGWKFMTLYRRQWSRPSPRKRNVKRQNGCLKSPEKKEAKGKGEKERYTHLNTEFQNIARREMKPLSEQCK